MRQEHDGQVDAAYSYPLRIEVKWRFLPKIFKDFIEQRLGFVPSTIDPDIYYRKNITPEGIAYYELLLVYVDDVLAMSHDPKAIMNIIGEKF